MSRVIKVTISGLVSFNDMTDDEVIDLICSNPTAFFAESTWEIEREGDDDDQN